jgi:hypothetical protein
VLFPPLDQKFMYTLLQCVLDMGACGGAITFSSKICIDYYVVMHFNYAGAKFNVKSFK